MSSNNDEKDQVVFGTLAYFSDKLNANTWFFRFAFFGFALYDFGAALWVYLVMSFFVWIME